MRVHATLSMKEEAILVVWYGRTRIRFEVSSGFLFRHECIFFSLTAFLEDGMDTQRHRISIRRSVTWTWLLGEGR